MPNQSRTEFESQAMIVMMVANLVFDEAKNAYQINEALMQTNGTEWEINLFNTHKNVVNMAWQQWTRQQAKYDALKGRYDELKHHAFELAEHTSYAEIIGGISVNKDIIRQECDHIFDFKRKLDDLEFLDLINNQQRIELDTLTNA